MIIRKVSNPNSVNGRKNHHEQPTGITTYTTYPVFTVTATRSMTSTVVVPCGGVPDGHGRSDPGTGHGALHAREGGRSVKSPGEPVYYRLVDPIPLCSGGFVSIANSSS